MNIFEIKTRSAYRQALINIAADFGQLHKEISEIDRYIHFIDRSNNLAVLDIHPDNAHRIVANRGIGIAANCLPGTKNSRNLHL